MTQQLIDNLVRAVIAYKMEVGMSEKDAKAFAAKNKDAILEVFSNALPKDVTEASSRSAMAALKSWAQPNGLPKNLTVMCGGCGQVAATCDCPDGEDQ